MDVSITMASYNSRDLTRRSLESLFAKTQGLEYEVIVVDNASTDGSAEMIERSFPAIRLLRNPTNRGFAAAHNQALSLARGEFLLVLNSDVLFPDNVVKKMVDRLRRGPETVGVIGPQVLNADGTLAPSSRRKIFYSRPLVALSAVNRLFPFGRLLPMNFARKRLGKILGRIHDNFNPPAEAQSVEWVDGMCVLFRRALLEQTGLFDEQFFFDCEIGDLLIRSRACGWSIVYDPRIEIIHLGGFSRKQNSQILVESYRSNLIYYAKHRPGYVPMLRRLQSLLLGAKIAWLKVFAPRARAEELETLSETRRMIVDFNCDSAAIAAKIPTIGP